MIDVGIDSEKSFENHLDNVDEVFGERHSKGAREYFFIIQLVLHPGHQEVDVLAGTDFQGSFDIVAICPEILILGTSAHCWASLRSAKFCQNTIEYIDFVIEFNCIHCEPLIQVFSSWKLDSELQISCTDGHSCNLAESVASGSLLDLLLLFEGLGLVKPTSGEFVLCLLHILHFKLLTS